jgi:hypothetical protein
MSAHKGSYGLKACLHCDGGVVWDRDVNAARNILFEMLHTAAGMDLPAPFRHPRQPMDHTVVVESTDQVDPTIALEGVLAGSDTESD